MWALPAVAAQSRPIDPQLWCRLLHSVGRRMRDSRCLVQALALTRKLRRAGHAAELRLGVGRPEAGFQAHAWVELGGQVLDPQPAQLAALTRLALPVADTVAQTRRGAPGCG